VSFSSSYWRLAIDTVLEVVWSWQLLRKVVLDRIAGTGAVRLKSSLQTESFQRLDSVGGHRRRCLSLSVLIVMPLFFDTHTQLGIFAVALRNVAVPVSFAIDGKLAQTLFAGGAVAVLLRRPHSKPKLSNARIRKAVIIVAFFPSRCNL
jgi:hypothetical protein